MISFVFFIYMWNLIIYMNCNNHKATDVGKKKNCWIGTLCIHERNIAQVYSATTIDLFYEMALNSSFQTFYHFQNYLSSKYCSHFFKDVHVKSVFFIDNHIFNFVQKQFSVVIFFSIQILIVIFYPRVISLVLIECFQKFLVRDLCLVFFP